MKPNSFHYHQTSNRPTFTLSAIFEHFCSNSQFPYILAVRRNQIEFVQSFHFPPNINNHESKLSAYQNVYANKRSTNLFTEAISKIERNEKSKTKHQKIGLPESFNENIMSKEHNSKFSNSSKSKSKNVNVNMSPLRFRANNNNNNHKKETFDRDIKESEKDLNMANEYHYQPNWEKEITFEKQETQNNQNYPILPNNKAKEQGNTFKIINKVYQNEKSIPREAKQTNSIQNNSFESKEFDSFIEENKKMKSHMINHVGFDVSFQNIEHFGENRSVEARIGKIVPPFYEESNEINVVKKEKSEVEEIHVEECEIKKESSRIHIEVSDEHSEQKSLDELKKIYGKAESIKNNDNDEVLDIKSNLILDFKPDPNIKTSHSNNPESAKKGFKDLHETENIKNPYAKAYENEKNEPKESKISKLTDEQVCQIISSRKKMIIERKEGKESDKNNILDMGDLDINAFLKLESNGCDGVMRSKQSDVKVGNGYKFVATEESRTKISIEEKREELYELSSRFLNTSFVPHYLKDKAHIIDFETSKTEYLFVPSNIYSTKPTESQVFEVRRLPEQSEKPGFILDVSEIRHE